MESKPHHACSDLQILNGEGRQNYLCGTTPTDVKRGRVSLQKLWLLHWTYRGKKVLFLQSESENQKSGCNSFPGLAHSACTCKIFLSGMLPRAPNITIFPLCLPYRHRYQCFQAWSTGTGIRGLSFNDTGTGIRTVHRVLAGDKQLVGRL